MDTKNEQNKGSTWRIWDLHVHPSATDYSKFISNASDCIASVLGINDYCTVEGYEEIVKRGGIPDKITFPVVEFRMHNIVANRKNADPTKAGTKINFHLIFNNDPAIFNTIKNWLNSLECFNERGETVQLGTVRDKSKISFDFERVIEGLEKYKLLNKHCLVWLPYDEYGGIDDIDPNDNFFKLSLIKKAHIIGSSTLKQIDFFKWETDRFSEQQLRTWFDKPKPCIKGSDAHSIDYPFGCLKNQQDQPSDRHCWIKADTTFEGLKQILIEPDRVFIGDEPDLLKRVKTNQTKFIKSLSIKKITDAAIDDIWFNDFYIEFNSGLIAIIGKKGSGKSAITDILSLCGNTYQDPDNFSFLTASKFRKTKPYNLSEKFEACLTWQDDTPVFKRLNDNPERTLPERVKYIPQNFLERLCTNIDSDDFEKELKQIIYSHTPIDKRLGKSSLDELIRYKSSIVNDEIIQIQNEISRINLEIVDLENKASHEFRETIENQLKLKQDELKAHFTVQPKKPDAEQETDTNKELLDKITLIRKNITRIEEEIYTLKDEKSRLLVKQDELNRAIQFYKNLDNQLKKYQDIANEYVQILHENDLVLSEIFEYKIDTVKITVLVDNISQRITEIDNLLSIETSGSKAHELQQLNVQLKNDLEILDKPAKEQQTYLDNAKTWEEKKKQIEGDDEAEGSLKYYENQLKYLDNKLKPALDENYNLRKCFVEDLFLKKMSLIEIRKELFDHVTQFINDYKDLKKRYDVRIDVALELRSFPDNFFNYINQGRTGTFCGKDEGYKKLLEIIEGAHFDSSDGFVSFANNIVDNLKFDKRNSGNTPVDIRTELRKGAELSELYDFIFNCDFLQPVYNLKLGTKTLQELSPGERGALLLIFYLILDNDDIPLIIDQPEENIDNESVYYILVHFIKKVKEKRQIFIVTHNPNLAIVCDADQIVYMQINKENRNYVSFDSGAIENYIINMASLNILEGTLPAFNNRDSKYIRSLGMINDFSMCESV